MNLNKLYDLYFVLPNDNTLGLASKAINRLVGKILKNFFDSHYPKYYMDTASQMDFGINITEKRQKKIIVSMTSFPGRINEIWICVESLLRQTVKPDLLILWLSKQQFKEQALPDTLLNLCKRGLTIRWVDEDIRSYKKFFYTMQEYPEDIVLTVDDDVYYPITALENLIKLNNKYPDSICANRTHKIIFDGNGIKSYRTWIHSYAPNVCKPERNLFITGIGGVLYPPHCFSEEIFNKEVFVDICPFADDVWLNFCAAKKGTMIVSNNKLAKDFICVGKSQNEKLVSKNVLSDGNDIQIKAVIEYLNLQMEK